MVIIIIFCYSPKHFFRFIEAVIRTPDLWITSRTLYLTPPPRSLEFSLKGKTKPGDAGTGQGSTALSTSPLLPPIFSKLVNPIPTGEGQIMHTKYILLAPKIFFTFRHN